MPVAATTRSWYVIPLITVIFGLMSLGMIVWVERLNRQLRHDDILTDAMMDIQIQASTYHLRLEEVLSGITTVDAARTMAIPDQTVALIDALLHGGDTEHNRVSAPLADPEMRRDAEQIRGLVLRLQQIGQVRLMGGGAAAERQFEGVFREVLERSRRLEIRLIERSAGNQVTAERIFAGIMVAWSALVVLCVIGIWYHERRRKLAETQLVRQTAELTEHREHLAELVRRRTEELEASLEVLRLEMAERLQMCDALRDREREVHDLSVRLLSAQEVERKRISMELHDELGQSLNVVKLRLRAMERELGQGVPRLGAECEELLEYLDLVIENVRRLAMDLSPTILEALGLTEALRWLAANHSKVQSTEVTAEIAAVDRLIARDAWITIYRVVQEALTNAGKHAHARQVAVTVAPGDGVVTFRITDDGAGFDRAAVGSRPAGERGLGMATMEERVRLLGGAIEIESRAGEGCSIAFTLPALSQGG